METGSQYRIYSVANHALSPKRVTDPKNGKDWLIDWLVSRNILAILEIERLLGP